LPPKKEHVVRQRARERLSGVRARLWFPVTVRLDTLDSRLDGIDARLVDLTSRLDQIDEVVQTTGVRAAALYDTARQSSDTATRLTRRLDEIERLLGAPAAEP
jgi:hypothetical protein